MPAAVARTARAGTRTDAERLYCGHVRTLHSQLHLGADSRALSPHRASGHPNLQPRFKACPTDPTDTIVDHDDKRELTYRRAARLRTSRVGVLSQGSGPSMAKKMAKEENQEGTTSLVALSQPTWAAGQRRKNEARKKALHRPRGRPKGSRNKIDVQTLAAEVVKSRGGQLSVAHMNEVLEHLRGMIAITQPYKTERDEATGEIRIEARPQGNYEQWSQCIKLFTELAGKLAPYQSPRRASSPSP